jgi:hypothetical protein
MGRVSQSARMGAAKAGWWYLDRGCGVLVNGIDWDEAMVKGC